MSKVVQKKISDWVLKKRTSVGQRDAVPVPAEARKLIVSYQGPYDPTQSDESSEIGARSSKMQKVQSSSQTIMHLQKTASRNYYFQYKWWREFGWLETGPVGSVRCRFCREADEKGLFLDVMQKQDAFISGGYTNWKDGAKRFGIHETSQQHLFAVMKISALKSKSIQTIQSEHVIKSRQEARTALRTLFTSAIYLARQGLPFRGHEVEKGNFIQLLHLREPDISGMSSWMKQTKSYTSPDIQNEILKIVNHTILRAKISQIKQNGIFSLIVDETTDISGKEQVSICVQTVNNDLVVSEEFLGLYDTSSTKSDALKDLILDVLKRFDLDVTAIRGQCYDGAANVSGKFNGVAAKILSLEKRALFVHFYAHSLNLAIQDIIRSEELLRDCLSYVNDIGVLLKGSAKRLNTYEEILKSFDDESGVSQIKPQPLCETRWTVRGKNVSAVLGNYRCILRFLHTLSKSTDRCSTKASGLYTQLTKGKTYFGLLLLQSILLPTEILSKSNQAEQSTVGGTVQAASVCIKSFLGKKCKNEFNGIWTAMQKACGDHHLEIPSLGRKRKFPVRFGKSNPVVHETVEEKFETVFTRTLDLVAAELERRFNQSGIKQIKEFENVLLNWPDLDAENRKIQLNEISNLYESNSERLTLHLQMIHDMEDDPVNCDSITSFVSWFTALAPEVRRIYSEVKKFLKILVVLPISSASAERSFSALRRIKTFMRSTTSQERLNHCCVIHCYSEIAGTLDIESLMREFVNKDYSRKVFGNI